MSLKRLSAFVIVSVLLGLGVFFAFLVGATASVGGVVTLNMTLYNEMWPEYWLMIILTATAPYVLYYLLE